MKLIDAPIEMTMTSREIADLVESRHDNVKRTIERLADSGVIQLPPLEDVKNGQGQAVTEYHIGKRDSYVIVAQLSPAFTGRLVDRWQELEKLVAAPPVPAELSRMDLILMAMETERERLALAEQLVAAAPAIEFVDRYVDATGLVGFRQACKILKIKENTFREFLLEKGIAYRLGRELAPRAEHLKAGRFEVKAGVSTLNEHAFNSMRFTPKGLNWVAGEFAKHQLSLQVHH